MSQVLDTARRTELAEGVCFDPEQVVFEGIYKDELSAHRAKRVWIDAFENHFLLDSAYDLNLKVRCHDQKNLYVLRCEFVSACARYAFWRLTHHQAPEVQYIIETAHIPECEARHDEFISAPDLRSVTDAMVLSPNGLESLSAPRGFRGWVKRFVRQFSK